MSPEIVLPLLVTELATTTPMNCGNGGATGLPLFPGDTVHVPPHAGGVALKADANPLNAFGALPPLSALRSAHCAPQNVTSVAGVAAAAVRLPSTKAPRSRNANTVAVAVSDD